MHAPAFIQRLFGGHGDGVERDCRDLVALCRSLLGERGEASGAALARESLAAFSALGPAPRNQFFDILAAEFSPSPEAVGKAADAYRNDPTPDNLLRLQAVVEPVRQELFLRLNMAPGGTAALVAMRQVLLHGLPDHPAWHAVDADLLHLLRSWFNRGFLRLERIDWRTSALVLEKLIAYEAVHAIQGWSDLRRRLQADRRCFAFFHPSLPDEPLIFIEVALTRRVSAEVQPLLAPDAPVSHPRDARCAIFYSITNCQEGLRGISFGNFLIKQVAEELKQEFPRVRAFATLSPVPGFRAWLDKVRDRLAAGMAGESRLALLSRLDGPAWHTADDEPLRHLLTGLCAYYLLHAKQGRDPLDPVSRFHLGNGASLERLNWMGDSSAQGIKRSAGMMVNYVYRLDHVERNHERFVNEHVVVAARRIQKLARECPLAGDGREVPAR